MKKTFTAAAIAALSLLPFAAIAHEHQVIEINGIRYEFGIGSSNEPVVVDDKSGLELRVSKVGVVAGHEEHHEHASTEGAVEGLEKTLKVELQSGDARKTLDLVPAWSAPGFYNATFYPTEATEISYRLFGTIDDIPVDLVFTCKPQHDMGGESIDTARTELSPGVVRVEKRGAFGCPMEKAELGFPAQSSSLDDMQANISRALAVAFGGSILSLAALGVAWRRRA